MDLLRNVCRACLESPGEISIFRFQNTIIKLRCCTPITKIEKNNGLPENLCKDCAKSLNDSYKFYIKCAKSNTKLQKVLEGRNLDTQRDDLKNYVTIKSEDLVELDADITPLLMVIGAQPFLRRKCRTNLLVNNEVIKPIFPSKGKRKLKETNKEQVDREYVDNKEEVKEEAIEDIFYEGIEWLDEYYDEIEDGPEDFQHEDHEAIEPLYTEEDLEIKEANMKKEKYFSKPQSVESMNINKNSLNDFEETVRFDECLHDTVETVASNEKQSKECKAHVINAADEVEEYFSKTKSDIKEPQIVEPRTQDTKTTKREYVKQILDKNEKALESSQREHKDQKAEVTKATAENSQKCLRKRNPTDHPRKKISIIRNKKSEKVECDYCGNFFCGKQNVKVHILRKHNRVRPFQCAFCDKDFAIAGDKRQHEMLHTGERQIQTDDIRGCHNEKLENKDWQCSQCGKYFTRGINLQKHVVRAHTKNKPYQCACCGKRFALPTDKTTHERLVHMRERLRCLLCDKTFSQLSCMKEHFQKIHSKHNYKEGTAQLKKIILETQVQTNKKPDETDMASFDTPDRDCGENDWNEGENSEDTQETSIDELCCSFCPFSCFDKEQLELHINEHVNNKRRTQPKNSYERPTFAAKYPCEICGKAVSGSTMTSHIQTMHVFKEVKCGICKKVLRNSFTLKSHIGKHNEKLKNNSFECDHCGKICTTKQGVQGHILRKHMKMRLHKCAFCGKRFAGRNDKVQHQRLHTGERPYQCPLCDKTYAQLCNMKSHFKHNHKKHNYTEAMEEFKNFFSQPSV